MKDYFIFGNMLFTDSAGSNRTLCNRCQKYIKKDDMRLTREIPDGRFKRRRYWCKECAIEKLKEEHTFIDTLITEILR